MFNFVFDIGETEDKECKLSSLLAFHDLMVLVPIPSQVFDKVVIAHVGVDSVPKSVFVVDF